MERETFSLEGSSTCGILFKREYLYLTNQDIDAALLLQLILMWSGNYEGYRGVDSFVAFDQPPERFEGEELQAYRRRNKVIGYHFGCSFTEETGLSLKKYHTTRDKIACNNDTDDFHVSKYPLQLYPTRLFIQYEKYRPGMSRFIVDPNIKVLRCLANEFMYEGRNDIFNDRLQKIIEKQIQNLQEIDE